ncbi:hypothetical protein F4009_03355 [Candidatus Poribacteria bacterium]|nr:hypothetical protein [Candidatus Poribacteria bacterium]MYH83581.1 hypothetical protein [Candidatus Poribacteria bacterium]MYK93035.1 hypothetical protein [Candidatus Poribacteria bacterium]
MKTIFTQFTPIGTWLLFCAILFTAFWIRVQGVDTIPKGQFTGNDAYLYYWQAQLISEHGQLPTRDMHRWLPLGRDLEQTLNFYSYTLAYAYKVLLLLFPTLSLYQLTLYAPVICFCGGLAVLCFFIYRIHGFLFSSIVGVLLATFPGTIDRSSAGFSDRDSWCLMLGVFTVITYLASLQAQPPRRRLLWTFASGFTLFLGGISWEGFGVFMSIVLVVELWRFITSETEEGFRYYLLWVCTFVPTLYFASSAYRNGQGFSTHLSAFMLVPPLVLLGIRALRCFLMSKAQKFRLHARTLALGLTLASSTIAIGYVFTQLDTFTDTTVLLSQNRLMRTIGELKNPNYNYWVFRFGSLFFLGSLGFIGVNIHLWKKLGTILVLPLATFVLTTFFRGKLENYLGSVACNNLFFLSIACIVIGFLIVAWRRRTQPKNEYSYVAVTAWFILWVALARGAVRYDFFIGIPLAVFATILIQFISDTLSKELSILKVPKRLLKMGITVTSLVLLLFWTPIGAHAKRAIFASTSMQTAKPGNSSVAQAFKWMKAELPGTAVVAAHWPYGSQLNVLAGVKTIIDQDHYIQHWIYLYERYVYHAANEREVLEFLKTHGVTHLILTLEEPIYTLLRRRLSDAFLPVYPKDNFSNADVKVWAIHYPPDIQPHPKYLATEPEK